MNELEKRAAYHRKRLKGLSPFCSMGEGYDFSSVEPDVTKFITKSIGVKNWIDADGNLIKCSGEHFDALLDIIGNEVDLFSLSEKEYDELMDSVFDYFQNELGWIAVSKEFVPHIGICKRPTSAQENVLLAVMDNYKRRPQDLNVYCQNKGESAFVKYNLYEITPDEVLKKIHNYFRTGVLAEDWKTEYEHKFTRCPNCRHYTLLYDPHYCVWACSECGGEFMTKKDGNKVEFVPKRMTESFAEILEQISLKEMNLTDIYKTVRQKTFGAEPGNSLIIRDNDSKRVLCQMTQSFTPGQWKYREGKHRGWYTTENACMFLSYTARDNRNCTLEIIKDGFNDMRITETQHTQLSDSKDNWILVKNHKFYDPEGLGIEPQGEQICRGTEGKCRTKFNELVRHFQSECRRVNNPQLTKIYIYFMRLSQPDDNTLIVEYPQAKSKEVYQLIPCADNAPDEKEYDLMSMSKDQAEQTLTNFAEGTRLLITVDYQDKDKTYIFIRTNADFYSNSAWKFMTQGGVLQWNYMSSSNLATKIGENGNSIFGNIIDVKVDRVFLTEGANTSLQEGPHKKKKKRPFNSINKNAGDVEHNINMFNMTNSPIDSPCNNPVSGPMGGNVSCCEEYDKETKTYSYSRLVLNNFCREVDKMVDDVCRKGGIDKHTAHLQDWTRQPSLWVQIERGLVNCADMFFESSRDYNQNHLHSYYRQENLDGSGKYGNFSAFAHYLAGSILDDKWKKVDTKTPVQYILDNCKNDTLYLIKYGNGSKKVSASKYLGTNDLKGKSTAYGIGSQRNIHETSYSVWEDDDGNIGVKGTTLIWDSLQSDAKNKLIEGLKLGNGMVEREQYYFDDGDYSYHFFDNANAFGKTDRFAILVIDYGFEFHYDQQYNDDKTNTIVIPTSMRHEKPKQICYFEFTEESHPDIFNAYIDDDMNAFREAVKAETERQLRKTEDFDKDAFWNDIFDDKKNASLNKYRIYYCNTNNIPMPDMDVDFYADIEAKSDEEARQIFYDTHEPQYEITGSEEFIKNNPLRKCLGESVSDKVELEYEDLDIGDYEIDWTYKVDREDILGYLADYAYEKAPGYDTMSDEEFDKWCDTEYDKWLDENLDDLIEQYKEQLLDFYLDDALEDACCNYDPMDDVDWDMMPGGHDYEADRMMFEEKSSNDNLDDNFDMFMRGV